MMWPALNPNVGMGAFIFFFWMVGWGLIFFFGPLGAKGAALGSLRGLSRPVVQV